MTIRKQGALIALASALALTVPFALTGCAIDTDADTPFSEDGILQEPEINSGDDNLNDDGFLENWADLPKDWPTDIPVVSEQVTDSSYGETPDGKDWQVDIFPDDLDADLATARQLLNDAGFTEESWETTSDGAEGVFLSATHRVVLSSAISVWGDEVVRYEVTPL